MIRIKIPMAGINGIKYCIAVLLESYRLAHPSFGISGKASIVVKTEPSIIGAIVKVRPYAMTKAITEKPK